LIFCPGQYLFKDQLGFVNAVGCTILTDFRDFQESIRLAELGHMSQQNIVELLFWSIDFVLAAIVE
jgi:hypothetical protein